jgi:hypothetical protein
MTIHPDLPDNVPVPASTAASFTLLAGEPSARDLSFAIGVMYLSAKHGTTGGRIDISENWMRAEVGQGRRQGIERDEDRYQRLASTHVLTPEGAARMPTMYRYEDGRYRTLGQGIDWIVDPMLQRAWTPVPLDKVAHFPLRLLRNARSRWSIVLGMKLIAWWEGIIEQRFEHSRRDDHLVLRFSIPELMREIAIAGNAKPAHLVTDVLKPAAEEISAYSDFEVAVEPVRVQYRGGKLGKVAFVEIRMAPVAPDRSVSDWLDHVRLRKLERLAEWEASADAEAERQLQVDGKVKKKTWRRPVRNPNRMPKAPPANATNVSALPIDKIIPAFAQFPPTGRIAISRPPGQSAPQRRGDGE